MSKILVIGLDGATLEIIEPLAKSGRLPNLARIMDEGCYGVLQSTMPPLSPVAWTSMITGVNPGKHGIFDFVVGEKSKGDEPYRVRFLCGGDRKIDPVWVYLNRKNRRSIVINVPMTYPPEPIEGIVISGMDTPTGAQEFVYPPSLREKLDEGGEYVVEVPLKESYKKNKDVFFEQFLAGDVKKFEVASSLMEGDWDFCMVVYTHLDRCQHLFTRDWDWSSLDQIDKDDLVLRYYIEMDRIIGEMIAKAGSDSTTFIVSDHGFGFAPNAFSLTKWLVSSGYMVVNSGTGQFFKEALGRGKRSLMARIPAGARRLLAGLKKQGANAGSNVLLRNIDWSKTRAYCEGSAPKLKVNRDVVKSESEAEALIESLIGELRSLKDPETGAFIFKRAVRGADVYHGPFQGDAADIILELDRGYMYKHLGLEDFGFVGSGAFLEKLRYPGGEHLPNGIFFASGKNIRRAGRIADSDIVDVIPTVLYMMGEAVPTSMDGHVISSAINPEFLEKNRLETGVAEPFREKRHDLTEEEKKEIEERLKSLGYM